MSKPRVIAIDGPAASGKTTLGLSLARELGYLYFDTGVMYRAVTLAALHEGVNLDDEDAVEVVARKIVIDVTQPTAEDGRAFTVILDGQDVTWDLRDPEIDSGVSIPSTYTGVRAAMTEQQRRIASRGDIVMVGRDIGTVVLPDADLKIYLDASPEARARRRWQEYQADGRPETYEQILAAMKRRDRIDSQRAVAPLKIASDAVVIDTTSMHATQVMSRVLEEVDAASADRIADMSAEPPENSHD